MITQVDEGHTAAGDIGWSLSSSCSKPSIVADMFDALEVRPGHSVLEIGTGTGWNAALLCRQVGTRSHRHALGTDCCNGVMLTLHVTAEGSATGHFHGDLAFMRLPSHRRRFYEPDEIQFQHSQVTSTDVHGWDFYRMINSDQAGFSIGLQVPRCALTIVHQLGPRRLWDEAVAAYDWWYEHDKPDLTRFGMTMTTHTQAVWLDDPSTIVRVITTGSWT